MAAELRRIRLKYSEDPESTLLSDISSTGPDTILPGELVVGIDAGSEAIYTVNNNGDAVVIPSIASRTNNITGETRIKNIVSLTAAEYTALTVKDAATLYIVL